MIHSDDENINVTRFRPFEGRWLAAKPSHALIFAKAINGRLLIPYSLDERKLIASNSVVEGVCCELAIRKGKPMDDFAERSVIGLVKHCYKSVCPKPRPKKPTRLQRQHQFETALVLQRRRNGSL